jgi:hypothetical protein
MNATPCGRLAGSMVHATVTCELALAMDATLEATQRDLSRVRAILEDAIRGLVEEFGEKARREAVVSLQFQDLADQLLCNATRRLAMVREVLGKDVQAPAEPLPPEPLTVPAVEFFAEGP